MILSYFTSLVLLVQVYKIYMLRLLYWSKYVYFGSLVASSSWYTCGIKISMLIITDINLYCYSFF